VIAGVLLADGWHVPVEGTKVRFEPHLPPGVTNVTVPAEMGSWVRLTEHAPPYQLEPTREIAAPFSSIIALRFETRW
jgi:hypothetical protein